MLQAASTDLFNPLVPKAHNSECQNLLFPFIKPVCQVKASLRIFIFCTLGTNGIYKIDSKKKNKFHTFAHFSSAINLISVHKHFFAF